MRFTELVYTVQNSVITNKYLWRLLQVYVLYIRPWLKDISSFMIWSFGNAEKNAPKKSSLKNMNLTIETTSLCNAKCVFCAYKKINDPHIFMPMEIFKKVVDEFHLAGGKNISLSPVVGDVFTDKELFKRIAYAKEKGMEISICTNGFLLKSNENYKNLIDSDVDFIAISVGDVNIDIDSEIYGVTKALSKMRWDGVLELLKYADKKGALKRIHILFRPKRKPWEIVRDKNYSQIRKFVSLNKATTDYLLGYDNWGGKITKHDLLGIMKFKRALRHRKLPCWNMEKTLAILPNGDARLCGCRIKDSAYDELIVGNVTRESLKEITEGKKIEGIKERFMQGKYPPVCRECIFYEPLKRKHHL